MNVHYLMAQTFFIPSRAIHCNLNLWFSAMAVTESERSSQHTVTFLCVVSDSLVML